MPLTIKTDWCLMKLIRSSDDFLISVIEKRFIAILGWDYSQQHRIILLSSLRVQKVSRGKHEFHPQQRLRGKTLCKIVCKLYSLISFRARLFAIYHSITLSVYVQAKLSLDSRSRERSAATAEDKWRRDKKRMRHISQETSSCYANDN